MIILFTFIIIAIIFFVFMALLNHKNISAAFAIIFFIGIAIMIISKTIYQIHIGVFSHRWMQSNKPFYNLIMNIRFSFSTIQKLSVFGEVIVLFSLILITNIILVKNAKWHILLYVPLLIIYSTINNPDILYKLYLSINSATAERAAALKNVYHFLYALKIIIVALFFFNPFLICLYKYFTRKFTIIRIKVLTFSLVIVLSELLLITLIKTEYINSFFNLNLIILFSNTSVSNITEKAITVIICAFILFLFILTIKSGLFNKDIFDIKTLSLYDSNKRLDRTLRMILHTYKNMFLAINQLSKAALSSASKAANPPVPQNNPYISSIMQISTDALYNITHLLDMLSKFEITPQKLDLKDIIDTVIAKASGCNYIAPIINCPENSYFIYSDSLYITDLIYNIFQNACDAVKQTENPMIAINVASEDDWILIEIIDNGCGIPKEIKRHIFNPLVSNKQGTNNWGIGLYYAKKIVKAHNGYIFVDSVPNKNTKFEIYLPVYKQK